MSLILIVATAALLQYAAPFLASTPLTAQDVTSLVGKRDRFRFAAFGDSGTGRDRQRDVAASLRALHQAKPFQALMLLGDLFYEDGVSSVSDPQWQSKFESIYPEDIFSIPIFPILGNHEYRGNIWAMVDYAHVSTRWKMHGRYYTYSVSLSAGTRIQFFAIDSHALSNSFRRWDGQLGWLEQALAQSDAEWKIVLGHHPAWSDGAHQKGGRTRELQQTIVPLMQRAGVQLYFSGHDHNLQLLAPEGGVLQVISGGGGKELYHVKPGPSARFAQSTHGFVVVEVEQDSLQLEFIALSGEVLFSETIRKIK